jgi:hypothetical protein
MANTTTYSLTLILRDPVAPNVTHGQRQWTRSRCSGSLVSETWSLLRQYVYIKVAIMLNRNHPFTQYLNSNKALYILKHYLSSKNYPN